MLEYITSTQFRRDHRKILANPRHRSFESAFFEVLSLLLIEKPLPFRFKEHKLLGEYKGCHECHLAPDLLMIYRFKDDCIELVRLGNHSDLF